MADLKQTDRCDRCGAQAYVETIHDASSLLWCAHHYVEHEPLLVAYVAVDDREPEPA